MRQIYVANLTLGLVYESRVDSGRRCASLHKFLRMIMTDFLPALIEAERNALVALLRGNEREIDGLRGCIPDTELDKLLTDNELAVLCVVDSYVA